MDWLQNVWRTCSFLYKHIFEPEIYNFPTLCVPVKRGNRISHSRYKFNKIWANGELMDKILAVRMCEKKKKKYTIWMNSKRHFTVVNIYVNIKRIRCEMHVKRVSAGFEMDLPASLQLMNARDPYKLINCLHKIDYAQVNHLVHVNTHIKTV